MKQLFVITLTSLLFYQCKTSVAGQEVKNSVYLEYSYGNLDNQPDYIKMMYGTQRVAIYADAQYLTMESKQERDAETLAKMGPAMQSTILHDFNSGKTFIGISMDTLKIKIEKTNEADFDLGDLMGVYRDSSYTISKTKTNENILNNACVGYNVEKAEYPSTEILVNPNLKPSAALSRAPMFMARGNEYYGLILGNNSALGEVKISLRATKLELDQPRNAGKILDGYRLVTEEEGNRLMNAIMSGGRE